MMIISASSDFSHMPLFQGGNLRYFFFWFKVSALSRWHSLRTPSTDFYHGQMPRVFSGAWKPSSVPHAQDK